MRGSYEVRAYCEIIFTFPRINETMREIKHAMERRPEA